MLELFDRFLEMFAFFELFKIAMISSKSVKNDCHQQILSFQRMSIWTCAPVSQTISIYFGDICSSMVFKVQKEVGFLTFDYPFFF